MVAIITVFANVRATVHMLVNILWQWLCRPENVHACFLTGRRAPGFLVLLCPQMSVCACVSAPEAINN